MSIAVPTGRRAALGPRVFGLLLGAVAAIAAIAVFTGGHKTATGASKPLPETVTAAQMLDTVGARVVRVTTSGAGGLLDMRYQVVDADKAAALHDAKYPPALVDEHSGQVIGRLLMGHAHSGTFHAGVTYYAAFENPGGLVKRGDPVSVVLGPVRLQHVRVQ
jgi:hypothetical protein